MPYKILEEELRKAAGSENVKTGVLMKHHTSFKVGGPADIMVTPCDEGQISEVMNICRNAGVPVFVMGNGSNLVVRDKGIRGVVIKLFGNFSNWSAEEETITAQAGLLLSRLSKIALEHGLSGLEFASGIPGTVGGAVFMNAGAYGGEMKDAVASTRYLAGDGSVVSIKGDEHLFGYRTSIIQKTGGIVLSTSLQLKRGDSAAIKARMEELDRKRKDKQPLELPSAGSVFKRPDGYFTGKLIEDCGLKGFRVGGAEVSGKHCGFIVNSGNASADDIIKLIDHIKQKVKAVFGVELSTEVRIVGEE